jgi:hypothetical protein
MWRPLHLFLFLPQPEPGEARWSRMLEGVHCLRIEIVFTRMWRLLNHQEHKVIIIGLDNAREITILYQFSMNEVVLTTPTTGHNVEKIVIKNTHFLR